jgi:CheY-like chemotaxis protein
LTPPSGAGVAFPVADVLAKPLRRAALARALVPLRDRLLPGRPVLVVDDEAASRELMCVALQASGIECRALDSGAAALAQLDVLQPAAMVLDLMMPGIDGFQVLHELRRHPRWADLPVIVWSALALGVDEIESLSRSAHAIAEDRGRQPQAEVSDALLRAAQQRRRAKGQGRG